MRDNGELAPRTWAGYKSICDILVERLGKHRLVADLTPDDFAKLRDALARRWGPVVLGNTIQVIRGVFKHAYEAGLVQQPIRFGHGFKRPSKKTLRLERAKKGQRMFEAEELHRILAIATQPLRAMILLGVNCGLGNHDCGRLPLSAVNLEAGWIDFPRPKTGIPRRCKLWGETVEALRETLARRPEPKETEAEGMFFVTKYGQCWAKDTRANPVSAEMKKLLNALSINGHRGFYSLRHTYRTIADEARDQAAVDHTMGHARDDMASVYREGVADDRLVAVANHVRGWLFAKGHG